MDGTHEGSQAGVRAWATMPSGRPGQRATDTPHGAARLRVAGHGTALREERHQPHRHGGRIASRGRERRDRRRDWQRRRFRERDFRWGWAIGSKVWITHRQLPMRGALMRRQAARKRVE